MLESPAFCGGREHELAAVARPRRRRPGAAAVAGGAAACIGSGVALLPAADAPGRLRMPCRAMPWYRLALDARTALGGDAAALAALRSSSQKMLEESAARDAGAPYATDPRFTRLVNNAGGGGARAHRAHRCRQRCPRHRRPGAAPERGGCGARGEPAAGQTPTARAALERFDARAQRARQPMSRRSPRARATRRRRRSASPKAAIT